MNFTVKKHSKSEFYDTFIKWCDEHKFPRANPELLPENIFVCYNEEEQPIYCIWFYFTDSKLAWLAFPVSNKKIAFKKRELGFAYLMNQVENYAKRKGIKLLFTTSGTDSVIDVLTKSGFEEGDKNVTQYFKTV